MVVSGGGVGGGGCWWVLVAAGERPLEATGGHEGQFPRTGFGLR